MARFKVQDQVAFLGQIELGNIDRVREYLEQGMPVNFCRSDKTPLIAAAVKGNVEIMQMLADAGAQINFIVELPGNQNTTRAALHAAIAKRCPNTITWLLDHGANPRIVTTEGWTAGHYLLARNDKRPEWQAFVPIALERMLEMGLPVNQPNLKGRTLLAVAAAFEHAPEVFNVLLSRGADPMIRDADGQMPIHLAARRDNPGPLETLLTHGVPIDSEDHTGARILHFYKNDACADAIYSASPDLEAQDHDGRTALFYRLQTTAPSADVPECIARLLAAGASVDTPNFAGKTPREIIEEKKLTSIARVVGALDARNVLAAAAKKRKVESSLH